MTAAEACADHILRLLREAITERGRATLAVSGGTAPRLLFAALEAAEFEWSAVDIFFVDERCVPPSDPASNYGLLRQSLRKPAEQRVHRIQGELNPQEAARLYGEKLREFFGGMPQFDVLHCGLGGDAHIASLFPGDPLLDDRTGITAASYSTAMGQWRVTLLPGPIVHSRHSVFYIGGPGKAAALGRVLDSPHDPRRYPAQLVAARSAFFLDAAE